MVVTERYLLRTPAGGVDGTDTCTSRTIAAANNDQSTTGLIPVEIDLDGRSS